MKKCPFCAEDIQDAAIKCRFCGSLLQAKGVSDAPAGRTAPPQVPAQSEGPLSVPFGDRDGALQPLPLQGSTEASGGATRLVAVGLLCVAALGGVSYLLLSHTSARRADDAAQPQPLASTPPAPTFPSKTLDAGRPDTPAVRSLLTSGWRYPTESDLSDPIMRNGQDENSWRRFRTEHPSPYHIHADIDGNGTPDDIWTLLRTSDASVGVFAFFNGGTEIALVWNDTRKRFHKALAQQTFLFLEEASALRTEDGHQPAVPGIRSVYLETEDCSVARYWDKETRSFRSAERVGAPKEALTDAWSENPLELDDLVPALAPLRTNRADLQYLRTEQGLRVYGPKNPGVDVLGLPTRSVEILFGPGFNMAIHVDVDKFEDGRVATALTSTFKENDSFENGIAIWKPREGVSFTTVFFPVEGAYRILFVRDPAGCGRDE